MPAVKTATRTEAPSRFTDVLYMTKQGSMPSDIKGLLRKGKLSFLVLPIDEFYRARNRLELIGTVVIDVDTLDILQQKKIPQIVEKIESNGVGVILLGDCTQLAQPKGSRPKTNSKSHPLNEKIEPITIDDLWVRISLNLAYRSKKDNERSNQPSDLMLDETLTNMGDLTQQLCVTETLVDNLAEQLRLAGSVQRDFLPTSLPEGEKVKWANVFLPAEWVSGDIYDVIRIDENHIGFYIADVVGHGIPAALLTIFLKQALIMRQTVDNSYHIFSNTRRLAHNFSETGFNNATNR
ncbi:MAG: PP2C family protein-serine/threonine phosphatase [Planctomycetota bacterium]|jgi:hypothetical protein